MEQQMEKRSEYRSIKFETRVEDKQEGGKKLVLRGYPIVFNTETTTYDFWYGEIRETILPTALDGTDLSDVYLITGHNIEPDKVLGRAGINMRLEVDETGLFFECELPNTQHARDIYNLVESGIVDGMSFGFYCSDQVNEETLTRTITHIDELLEITITPFPAYKEASVIAKGQRQESSENKEEPESDDGKDDEKDEETRDEDVQDAVTEDATEPEEDNAAKEQQIKELEELLND